MVTSLVTQAPPSFGENTNAENVDSTPKTLTEVTSRRTPTSWPTKSEFVTLLCVAPSQATQQMLRPSTSDTTRRRKALWTNRWRILTSNCFLSFLRQFRSLTFSSLRHARRKNSKFRTMTQHSVLVRVITSSLLRRVTDCRLSLIFRIQYFKRNQASHWWILTSHWNLRNYLLLVNNNLCVVAIIVTRCFISRYIYFSNFITYFPL